MTKRIVRCLGLTSFFFAICIPLYVYAFTIPGTPSGYVNDFAAVLTPEQKNILEQKLTIFNASTTNEIAVVTVKNLGGDYIEHYAVELYKAWGIGTKKNDNGVLLLVAVDDHQMRIEVGYGLEGALTDAISSQIVRDDLTPAFKQNDFYGGISKATDDIIKVTQGEYKGATGATLSQFHFSIEGVLIFAVILIQFLSAILGRSKSWWAGGVVGAIVGGILTVVGFLGMTLVIGSVVTVVLVLLGLLFDFIVSKHYTQAVSSGSPFPWWIGGRGFGGGGGGSSSGGFGGGRSGGGGSSGSW